MSKSITIVFSLLSAFILTGCATFLSGKYSSEVDPTFKIDKSSSIFVYVGKDDLKSKFYVGRVIKSLKENGFTNVYSESDENHLFAQYTFVVTVDGKIDSYQYSSADYGLVNTGNSTTNCYGYGNYVNCSTTNNQSYGVTGYSQKTGYVNGHYFIGSLFDTKNDNRVFKVFGSTYEEQCDDNILFSFLIDQIIARLDFEKPSEYEFKVKMDNDFKCR